MKKLLIAFAAMLASTAAFAVVNVNTATKDELVALHGIGPAKAQAILDHRSKNGPFKSVDEVRKVKGIGDKLFAQIRPELTVSGAPVAPVAAKAAAPSAPPATAGAPGKPADAKGAEPKPSRADAGRIGR